MSTPSYAIPGSTLPVADRSAPSATDEQRVDRTSGARSVAEVLEGSQVEAVLQELDRD